MKTANIYAADIATKIENSAHSKQPALTLAKYTELPTTTAQMSRYIDNLLTADEQAVCNMATD